MWRNKADNTGEEYWEFATVKSWSEKGFIENVKLEQWFEPLWEWDVQIYEQRAFQTEGTANANTCEMLPGVFKHQQRNQ